MRKTRCLTWDKSNFLGLAVAALARLAGSTPASPAAPATAAALATKLRRFNLSRNGGVGLSLMSVSSSSRGGRQEVAGAVGPAAVPDWARPVTSAIALLWVS